MNELFGSFLIVPFLFSVQFLSLFELEEQNHTLKNILVIGISKKKIFLSFWSSYLYCSSTLWSIEYSCLHQIFSKRESFVMNLFKIHHEYFLLFYICSKYGTNIRIEACKFSRAVFYSL
ncbi:MAG: ABC transporter permease [Acetivibrio ethanolgignens]